MESKKLQLETSVERVVSHLQVELYLLSCMFEPIFCVFSIFVLVYVWTFAMWCYGRSLLPKARRLGYINNVLLWPILVTCEFSACSNYVLCIELTGLWFSVMLNCCASANGIWWQLLLAYSYLRSRMCMRICSIIAVCFWFVCWECWISIVAVVEPNCKTCSLSVKFHELRVVDNTESTTLNVGCIGFLSLPVNFNELPGSVDR